MFNATQPVDMHVAHHGKPVLVRFERAQVVGQQFRQHGYDTVGEIDGVAPFQGGFIKRGTRPDIV